MKKTSVDWLAEQHEKLMNKYVDVMLIKDSRYHDLKKELLQTARKMHREEVEGAVSVGRNTHIKAKDYYTQTFETP